jgi:hypothetical protein
MSEQKIMIRKADGALEQFDIEKFEHSLRRSHASPTLIQKVIDHVATDVEEGMTTHEIYEQAFHLLHKLERPAAARYSMRRAVMSLGPSGFPFEKFIAEIFKTMGYEALTDQTIFGGCVEHEIDVIAWNEQKLIMSEVKFHNELGLKSDLKVVLYVKARFDDLIENTYDYGNKNRKIDEGWLITNTKFTSSAIKYSECKDLKIVGWDYPVNNSLKDMIERSGINPITCLNSLSEHDKKALLEKNVIICKTLVKEPAILESIGLSLANIEAVLEEIAQIEVPVETQKVV